jgi:hypothetical protein
LLVCCDGLPLAPDAAYGGGGLAAHPVRFRLFPRLNRDDGDRGGTAGGFMLQAAATVSVEL